MVSESRKRELSAGVLASVKLRAVSRHRLIDGDSVFEGTDAGLHAGHDEEVQARTAAIRDAKRRKLLASPVGGEQAEQLTRTELEDILPGEAERRQSWPSPPRKATPEVIREAAKLRAQGWSGAAIGERLGISKTLANRISGGPARV